MLRCTAGHADGATATRLSDARCLVIGPQGIGQLDRQALAGMVGNPPQELKKFRLDENVHVRTIADGVALIAYKVSEELLVDGKLEKLDAYDSSVWVRRDGGWVCAAHTEALADK